MQSALLKRVRKISTLGDAWRVVLRNANSSSSIVTKREVREFAENVFSHLTKIQRQLNRNAFKFRPSRGVPIPKKSGSDIRPIVVAPIQSRIVQRAIHDVLMTVPDVARLTKNPHSFGGVPKLPGKLLGAVPAAIKAALDAIGQGASYFVRSDISAFFTRIPKPLVTEIVARATNDEEFVAFFREAIAVELENLAELRERAPSFPTKELGVAQGCCLSPLFGQPDS